MENIKNIISKGLKNGGFTIDKELKDINEKNGFMVSIIGFEKTYTINDLEKLGEDIKTYQNIIATKKNYYIGLWIDQDIIYLDISKHYKDKQNAIEAGIENNQMAIWDIKKGESIDLRINTYILYKINKINGDLTYIAEYLNIKEIAKKFKVKNIYNYITKDIEDIKNVLNGEYIIFNDKVAINEL